MEEKDIIPFDKLEKESYVLVERNKRRERARALSYFKRGLLLLLLVGICFGAYRLLPHIKAMWNKIPWTTKNEEPSNTEGDTATPPANSSTPNENVSTEDGSTTGEYKINEIGTKEFIAINESGCDFDFSQGYIAKSLEEIYKQYGNEAPVVLITHSQIRESYSNGKDYSRSSNFYSDNQNVSEIGKAICQELCSHGVNAIQISELYASGSIYGSRSEYEKALMDTLKRYPSITYVFNISRGLTINDDMTMDKSSFTKDERSYAQLSLICGTSSSVATENQTNNVFFAFDFAKFANEVEAGLIKEGKISRFPLSQNFGPISLNVDVGEYANSFDEAQNSAISFALILSDYLKKG